MNTYLILSPRYNLTELTLFLLTKVQRLKQITDAHPDRNRWLVYLG